MRTVKINPDEPIASYKAAFEQANGRQPPFKIVYERGWFRFQEDNGTVISRSRLRWLKVMTDSLLRRVPASSFSKSICPDAGRYDRGECCGGACLAGATSLSAGESGR